MTLDRSQLIVNALQHRIAEMTVQYEGVLASQSADLAIINEQAQEIQRIVETLSAENSDLTEKLALLETKKFEEDELTPGSK